MMFSIPRKVLVLGLLFAPLAHGASEPTSASTPPEDQVVVEAKRLTVAKMAKEIKQAELNFYELYNTLNKTRRYATECENSAATGTRFKKTTCQPTFKTEAEQQEAVEFLRAMSWGDQVTGTPGGVTGPKQMMTPLPPITGGSPST